MYYILFILGIIFLIISIPKIMRYHGFDFTPQIPFIGGYFSKSSKLTEISTSSSFEMKKIDPILVKLTYKGPNLMPDDVCDNDVCMGDYIVIGENADTLRVDSPKCKVFKPRSYNFDSGPYNPETGTYEKIITNWDGIEERVCSWFDLPKNRIISRENRSFSEITEKKVWNYETKDEFGSNIVK